MRRSLVMPAGVLPGALLAAVLLATSLPASAQSTSTVRKIKETKTIVMGHRESSTPFSYLVSGNSQPMGYSVEVCQRVIDVLKVALGVPELKVDYKLVTPKDRIPMVKHGSVDLECGSTTNNLERQREVSFSVTTFVTGIRLVAKKEAGIRMLLNLKNKTVVSTTGTTPLKLLKEYNETYRYNMNILEAKDHAEAFAMVEDGRAAAFAMDDVLLAALIAKSKHPGDYAITVQALSIEPYGMMMRRGDPAFKRAVDDAIVALFRSGELKKIYAKWFENPIPPGINLQLPMSDLLQKVVTRPTDSGNPASYH